MEIVRYLGVGLLATKKSRKRKRMRGDGMSYPMRDFVVGPRGAMQGGCRGVLPGAIDTWTAYDMTL